MADKDKEPEPVKDPIAEARDAELASQELVRQAVFDATHDKDGNPKPIVP